MKLYFKGNANGNLSYSVDGGNTFVPTSLQALRDGVPLPDDTDYSSVKVKVNSTILGTLDIIKQIEVSEGSNGIEVPVDMRLHNSSGDECDLFSRESLFNFDYDTIHEYLSATYSYSQIYLKTVNNKYPIIAPVRFKIISSTSKVLPIPNCTNSTVLLIIIELTMTGIIFLGFK